MNEAYLEAQSVSETSRSIRTVSRYERLKRSTEVSKTPPLHGLEPHGVNLSDYTASNSKN